MSIRSRLGVAAAAILLMGTAGAAMAQGSCPPGSKMSKQIAKPMDAAQKAISARKWQEVLTNVRAAEATTGYIRSAYDQFWMNEFKGYAYLSLRQEADAARELEAGLNSPCMAEGKKPERLKNLVGIYTNMRNFPKALEFGNRALKISRDPEVMVAVAQAYYQSGNNKESVRVMKELMASLEGRGAKPKEQQLLLIRSACDRAGDRACVAQVWEKLVSYYPKPDYWENLTVSLRQIETTDLQELNVMRLAVDVKVLKKAEDYKEFAQLALERGFAGEAQTVLEAGFTNKIFVDDRQKSVNTRLLEAAKKQAAIDKAALAKNEAAAVTGDQLVKVGGQYLGFGDNVKAVALIQKGITKGGLGAGEEPGVQAQLADEASILLGIAHLRNNNKVEAAKAFRAVKRDATMTRIAKLWLLNT